MTQHMGIISVFHLNANAKNYNKERSDKKITAI